MVTYFRLMSYFVYILQSLKDEKYYIGSTLNVEDRLKFHNTGLQRSTKHRLPFILVYQEQLADKATALKREKQIKSYKGGEAFQKLLRDVAPPRRGTSMGC